MRTGSVKSERWGKPLLFVRAVVSEPGQVTAEGDWAVPGVRVPVHVA